MLPGGCSLTAFRQTVTGVVELARQGTLADRIGDHVKHSTWQLPSKAESRSWANSLPVLASDLGRGRSGCEVESRRVHNCRSRASAPTWCWRGWNPYTGRGPVSGRRAEAVELRRPPMMATQNWSSSSMHRRAALHAGLQVAGLLRVP